MCTQAVQVHTHKHTPHIHSRRKWTELSYDDNATVSIRFMLFFSNYFALKLENLHYSIPAKYYL